MPSMQRLPSSDSNSYAASISNNCPTTTCCSKSAISKSSGVTTLMKTESFKLHRVHYMPKQLEPGILYVAEEFGAVAHLCACGCGAKIRTPLGPTEWALTETTKGPSLWPSVGNWQKPCRSHYIITGGAVEWAGQWTP